MEATDTLKAINDAILKEAAQEAPFRKHLGASVIGRKCPRELWYIFRWARRVTHSPRMNRLFNRGHLEELRFIEWLQGAGINVQHQDPDTGKQLRVAAHEGHFGGSLDAKLTGVPEYPDVPILGEFKTSNKKSFTNLQRKGLLEAKPEHYVQMQIYMHLEELKHALYMCICKDNDELFAVFVDYDEETALRYLDRALRIILSEEPPQRISSSPAWYECKFCDFQEQCHQGAPLEKNCRTCLYSQPTQDGTWTCLMYSTTLTTEQQLAGCTEHDPYRND